jgi:hypothetical protein
MNVKAGWVQSGCGGKFLVAFDTGIAYVKAYPSIDDYGPPYNYYVVDSNNVCRSFSDAYHYEEDEEDEYLITDEAAQDEAIKNCYYPVPNTRNYAGVLKQPTLEIAVSEDSYIYCI